MKQERIILYFAVLLAYISLSSCRAHKSLAEPIQSVRDSFRIEYRERVEYLPETVYYQIPLQEKEITKKDTFSRLENDYAVSMVRLNEDGSMTHWLNTKPQLKPIETKARIEYRDSLIYRDREVRVPYPVEKEIPKWDKLKIDTYWCIVGAMILALGVCFRKPIRKIIRRFI